MDMSSPSRIRLPHASAGPFWCPPAVEPHNEWHEIETLLSVPYESEEAQVRRGIRSFVFVAAALTIGGGVLAWTLIGSRNDCGADCQVVTATAGPTGAVPRPVSTAGLAPRSDATVTEGRSVAEPTPGADNAALDTAPLAPPLPKHRHHHRHHHAVDF